MKTKSRKQTKMHSPSSEISRRLEVRGPQESSFCWSVTHFQLNWTKSRTIAGPTVSFSDCCRYMLQHTSILYATPVEINGCFLRFPYAFRALTLLDHVGWASGREAVKQWLFVIAVVRNRPCYYEVLCNVAAFQNKCMLFILTFFTNDQTFFSNHQI